MIDSGASSSCISKTFADTIGVSHLMDTNFQGRAVGVGSAAILGAIHDCHMKIGSDKITENIFVL